MSKRILIEETKWYLSYQDGPADNEVFETEEEAKQALKKLRKSGKGMGRDVYVSSRTVLRDTF